MNVRSFIAEHLNLLSRGENTVRGSIVFPETFFVFAGHFPGNPTLPGVCELICTGILLEKAIGKSVRLSELSRAKFFSPVAPGETLEFELTWEIAEDMVSASVKIFSGERKIALFRSCKFKIPLAE